MDGECRTGDGDEIGEWNGGRGTGLDGVKTLVVSKGSDGTWGFGRFSFADLAIRGGCERFGRFRKGRRVGFW